MKTPGTGRVSLLGTLLLAAALGPTGGCVVHPRGACGPACATIKAATTIDYPTERLSVLKRIAPRDDLSAHEQTYLVNAICAGGFSSDQADALITLLENPCCTEQTRKHVARQLPWIGLGSQQRRVLDAMIENPGRASPQQK